MLFKAMPGMEKSDKCSVRKDGLYLGEQEIIRKLDTLL